MIEYGVLIIYLSIWMFFFVLVCLKSGIKHNVSYLFVMVLLIWYDFITPIYGLSHNWLSLFGNDISEYFVKGVFITILSMTSISISYVILLTKFPRVINLIDDYYIPVIKIRIIILSGIIGLCLWASLSGFSISSLFLLNFFKGDSALNLSWDDATFDSYNYLKQCVEFLIPGLVFVFASKEMKLKEKVFWFFLALILFISLSFRYRIIVVFFSVFIFSIFKNGFNRKLLINYSAALLILIVFNVAFGNARTYIKAVTRGVDIDMVALEDRQNALSNESLGDSVFKYTRNYISNMSLIKYIDQGYVDYDYGSSMFYQVLVRSLPASFFGGNKPFPKSLQASADSWHSNEGLTAGEAFTYVLEFYFSFGMFGVVFLSMIMGAIIFLFSRVLDGIFNTILVSVTTALLFQYVVRGFLPGFLMSYLFVLIPFIYIKFSK